MIKNLLSEWLAERRRAARPPLPQDATIYIMAFVEYADEKAAQHCMQRTASQAPQIVTVTGEDGKPEDIAIL